MPRLLQIVASLVTAVSLYVVAKPAWAGGCDHYGCGTNSSIIDGVELDHLDLTGKTSRKGFQLQVGSLKVPGRGGGLRLDIQDGELRALDRKGRVVARGMAMAGSRFKIVRFDEKGRGRNFVVKIARMDTTRRWVRKEGKEAEEVFVYDFRVGPLKHNGKRKKPKLRPICERDAVFTRSQFSQGHVRGKWTATRRESQGLTRLGDRPNRMAFAVRGETYTPAKAKVQLSGRRAKNKVTIACAESAVAKMKLMGYAADIKRQHPLATNPGQRQAAMKMLAASYCDDQKFTRHGVDLHWNRRLPEGAESLPADRSQVEAIWSPRGAVCLNEPRIVDAAKLGQFCEKPLPRCDALSDARLDRIRKRAELVSFLPETTEKTSTVQADQAPEPAAKGQ